MWKIKEGESWTVQCRAWCGQQSPLCYSLYTNLLVGWMEIYHHHHHHQIFSMQENTAIVKRNAVLCSEKQRNSFKISFLITLKVNKGSFTGSEKLWKRQYNSRGREKLHGRDMKMSVIKRIMFGVQGAWKGSWLLEMRILGCMHRAVICHQLLFFSFFMKKTGYIKSSVQTNSTFDTYAIVPSVLPSWNTSSKKFNRDTE